MSIPLPSGRRLPKTQAEWDRDLRDAWHKVREARHDVHRIIAAASDLVAKATVRLNEADNELATLLSVDRSKLPYDTA